MKKFQKRICILISLIMVIGMCSGCKKETESQSDVQSVTPSAQTDDSKASVDDTNVNQLQPVDFTNHEEFTIWLYATPNDYYASYSDNPIVKFINEKFNVTLSFEQPVSGTEADSLSLMFGTGQYTDLINISQYTGSIKQLYEDGVIVDLAKYLEYMPNLQRLLDEDDELRKHVIDDNGRMLQLPNTADEAEVIWGGMMYRYDILETMTGGNVQFPSGSDTPVTVKDWDYMLPLFKAYFEAAGMQEYAGLILPYNGYFPYGELATGFGFNGGSYYIDQGKVKHSFLDDGLYEYLKKMNEWYEAGYIYKDFASRINDMFFLPNTNLTYGGAAGIWYGFNGQLGDALSMPEYGLIMEVRPLASPLADGVTPEELLPRVQATYETGGLGSVVTTSCKNIPKLLSVMDYMYSEEGGMLRKYGLTKDQIPKSDTTYIDNGLDEGAYWYEGDGIVINPLFDLVGGHLAQGDLTGMRLPGHYINSYAREAFSEVLLEGDRIWTLYDDVASLNRLPSSLSFSTEDDKFMSDAMVKITDYVYTMIPKFIMGTEELNEASFNTFREQLISYGLQDCIDLSQVAYERYMKR